MSSEAPPSFSSFPELKNQPVPHSPPSFSSFPQLQNESTASTGTGSSRPSKRARATDFLDELEYELGGVSSATLVASSSRREHHKSSRHRDDERDGDRHKNRREKGKERADESEPSRREHRKKDRVRSEDRKRKDSTSSAATAAWDRDSEYGPQRRKPYQLVQGSADDVPMRVNTPPPNITSDKPVYRLSSKGDPLNIRYGGLHSGDVPRYRRLGAGRVLGLNNGLRITKETAYTGRGVEIAPVRTFKTPRYLDPRSARHLVDKNFKRVRLISQPSAPPRQAVLGEAIDLTAPLPPADPFLPSSTDSARFVPFEPERPAVSQAIEHEEGQDYRSIAGKAKAPDFASKEDDDAPIDDAYDELGIEGGESQSQYFKRRNLELDRSLREHPTDVRIWLKFVDFQDDVATASFGAGGGHSTKRALSKAERSSTSEIKLAILKRALDIEENQSSEDLLLAFLRTIADLWPADKVLRKWKDTLKMHPRLTNLWIEYVSWRQTTSNNFKVREVVEVFEECFAVINAAAQKESFGSPGREQLEANIVYLFLRLCLMLRQAGYPERSLAAFQAMIELNFYRPDNLWSPQLDESESSWFEKVIAALESFWDSEVPRIGEQSAKGWRNTPEASAAAEGTPDSFPTSDDAGDVPPLSQWATAERLTCLANPRPARTTDPGIDDEVDPFRVILFDDVRDILSVVHSPDVKTQLSYAFLTFLGLPFVPPDFPTSTPFSTDPFIHSELVERPALVERFWPRVEALSRQPFTTISGEAMEPERKSSLQEPFDTPFHATPVALDLMFASRPKWFQTLNKEDLDGIDRDLARNAMSLLRTGRSDTFLDLHFLSFEACQGPKVAIKLAKQILRDARQNLVLWDGYARVERQRGRIQEARQVYITALSMYRTFAPQYQIDGPLLWRSWAEMEWEAGRPMLALRILAASWAVSDVDLASLAAQPEDARPTPAQVLRARQQFTLELESAFQPNATQAIVRHRTQIASSAALFEYISRGLPAAVDVFEQHLFRLDSSSAAGSAEHEEAFMLYVKLLYRHSNAGVGYRPGQLRDVLERAIKEFRNNSLFLSVFYHNELRTKIQNRVRRTLEEQVLAKDATSEGWLFAIFAEMHLDARSPNVWGVRNLFDRAVLEPKTKSSPSIWTLYIEFEIRQGELRRAKSLVYRAVRECPWCKELYLKPFLPALSSVYRASELREWYSLLLEKGLRVRVEIDPYIGDIEGGEEDAERWIEDGPSEDARPGDMVAEDLLHEREELKPY